MQSLVAEPKLALHRAELEPTVAPLALVYQRHAAVVYRRARQLLGNDADAREVVQDVFLSLHEQPDQFAGRSSMTTFLYSVTTHRCLSQIRDRKNRARLDEINLRASDAGEVDPGLSPEDRLTLHQAIRELPEDMAQAAVYSLLDGMTHAEIAAILSCSRRHVGDLLARLEQWEPSP